MRNTRLVAPEMRSLRRQALHKATIPALMQANFQTGTKVGCGARGEVGEVGERN